MKFASVVLLLAQVSMWAHQQLPREATQVTVRRLARNSSFGTPGTNSILPKHQDRTEKEVFDCRSCHEVAFSRHEEFPSGASLQGWDLFAGCFQSKLEEEVGGMNLLSSQLLFAHVIHLPQNQLSSMPIKPHLEQNPLHSPGMATGIEDI